MQRWDDCLSVKLEDSDMKGRFFGTLRDAMFQPDKEDYDREKARLQRKNTGVKPSHAAILPACRRVIHPPEILYPKLKEWEKCWWDREVEIHQARTVHELAVRAGDKDHVGKVDDKGRPLFLRPTLFNEKFAETKRKQMKHVCRRIGEEGHDTCNAECAAHACLSDPPGVVLHYNGHSRHDIKARPYTMRGTNANEFSHPSLAANGRSRILGARRADVVQSLHVHEWNINQGQRRLGHTNYHTVDTKKLELINAMEEGVMVLAGRPVDAASWTPSYPDLLPWKENRWDEQFGVACARIFDHSSGANFNFNPLALRDDVEIDENEEDYLRRTSLPLWRRYYRSDGGSGGGQWALEALAEGRMPMRTIARGDGRCLMRAFGFGLVKHGLIELPPGVELLQGTNAETLAFLREVIRVPAAQHVVDVISNGGPRAEHYAFMLLPDVPQVDPEDPDAPPPPAPTPQQWLDSFSVNDDDQENTELWGTDAIVQGLGGQFDVTVVMATLAWRGDRLDFMDGYTAYAADALDRPTVTLLMHVGHDGRGVHFDLIPPAGADWGVGIARPREADALRQQQQSRRGGGGDGSRWSHLQKENGSIGTHIPWRTPSISYLQQVAGLALRFTPISEEGDNDDERKLFQRLYGARPFRNQADYFSKMMGDWNDIAHQEMKKRFAELPHLRIELKTTAQLKAWHKKVYTDFLRARDSEDEISRQRLLRYNSFRPRVELGPHRQLQPPPQAPFVPPPDRQPFQEIFTFPSQANQVGVTIAPRQHAPASGLPLFLVASSQNAPPPPPRGPPPQQQQLQQQGVQRLFYKSQWKRLAPTSKCGGCWKDKRRHFEKKDRGENCPDECPGCKHAVSLHTQHGLRTSPECTWDGKEPPALPRE